VRLHAHFDSHAEGQVGGRGTEPANGADDVLQAWPGAALEALAFAPAQSRRVARAEEACGSGLYTPLGRRFGCVSHKPEIRSSSCASTTGPLPSQFADVRAAVQGRPLCWAAVMPKDASVEVRHLVADEPTRFRWPHGFWMMDEG
jgi:hypothetical protein